MVYLNPSAKNLLQSTSPLSKSICKFSCTNYKIVFILCSFVHVWDTRALTHYTHRYTSPNDAPNTHIYTHTRVHRLALIHLVCLKLIHTQLAN